MKQIKQENTREKILSAAIKLFAQKGFDGTSVREICKAADINICLISYHFGGKKELYNAILDELVSKQTEYAKTFIDFDKAPSTMSKRAQVELLKLILDKFVDFFYSNVSSDLISFLLREQQSPVSIANSPVLDYLRKLVASIFDKDENDKEIIFKTLFMLAQVNSPKILPSFSLKLLKQDDFTLADVTIIKNNLNTYVSTILKEVKID